MMPEEWRVVRLGEVTKKSFGGGTPSTKKPEYWDGLLPWITTAIINPQDVYLTRYQRRITEDGLKHSSTKKACKGCLLVGTRVGVGKAVVTTFDVAINQDLTAIELDIDTIQPEYVSLYFKTRLVQQWFASNKRGATIKGIPREDLMYLLLPLPPLSEQRAIADILQAVDRKIQVEEARKQALDILFKVLLNNLMTGKIRVKDPALLEAGGNDGAR